MADKVWIHVSENDRNGNPSGMAGSIQIGEAITFESKFEEGGEFIVFDKDKFFKVAGGSFVYARRRDLWGSMAFNGYEVDVSDAARLINALHSSSDWEYTEGWTDLLDFLETGEITPDQLSKCLGETVPPPSS